tara:strand:- start:261 stop:740 length:480 start_codon:yes stop_codon:yes gene_type:complete
MATLKVKIQEDIILDNQDYGSKRVLEISSINEIFKRIVTIPANNDTKVSLFNTSVSTDAVATASIDIEDAKYIRVTNLDSSNSVNLNLLIDEGEDSSASDAVATILLEAGRSFIMGTPHESIAVDDDASNVLTSLYDLESLLVDSGANAVNIEVVVASA